MKSAICFYGQPRHLDKTWSSILKSVIEPNNSDVYFHFWATHPDESHPWFHHEDIKWDVWLEDDLIRLMKPVKYILEPQIEFDTTPYPNGHCPTFNLMSFAYSVKKSHSLYDKNDYDAIIHCRSDLLFRKPVILENLEENTLYIEHRGTSGDQFAYGVPDVMEIFSSCYDHFPTLYQQIGHTHAETFFSTHMKNHGVKVVPCERNYSIQRHD